MTIGERLLTVAQVAEIVQTSERTIMRAIDAGHLEASQLTQGRGGWRVHPDAIDAWRELRSNRRRQPRPLAHVARVEPSTTARPRRSASTKPGSGTLRLPDKEAA